MNLTCSDRRNCVSRVSPSSFFSLNFFIMTRELFISGTWVRNFLRLIQIQLFKGTVSVILSDHPFVKWHVRFTTIPFKPLSIQGFRWYFCLYGGKLGAKKTPRGYIEKSSFLFSHSIINFTNKGIYLIVVRIKV